MLSTFLGCGQESGVRGLFKTEVAPAVGGGGTEGNGGGNEGLVDVSCRYFFMCLGSVSVDNCVGRLNWVYDTN